MRQLYKLPLVGLVSLSLLFSGCGSMVSGNGQKVTITSGTPNAEIYHNGKKVGTGTARIKVKRTEKVQEFVFKSDSLKPRRGTLGLEYRRGTQHLNLILLPTLYGAIYGYYIDKSNNRTYRYPSTLASPPLVQVPRRKANEKYILVNQTSALLKSKDTSTLIYLGLRNYKKRKVYQAERFDESIDYSNTIYEDQLNDLLKKSGYVDTVRKLFPTVGSTLYIDSKLTRFREEVIFPNAINGSKNGMRASVATRATVEWKVLDAYKRPLFSHTSNTVSDFFLIKDLGDKDILKKTILASAADAIEYALLDLQAQPAFQKVKMMESGADVAKAYDSMERIVLAKPTPRPDTKMSDLLNSSVTIKVGEGHGSGFIVSKDGYIVTNLHVVAGEDGGVPEVILHDGGKYKAEVVRSSEAMDLALLKIKADDLQPFLLEKDLADIGTEVWAVGTPRSIELGQSVSKGVISGMRKAEDKEMNYIQTDAAVNPGNSGGALITKDGRVQGVVSMRLTRAEGVGFAVPAPLVFKGLKLAYADEAKAAAPAPAVAPVATPASAAPTKAKAPAKKGK